MGVSMAYRKFSHPGYLRKTDFRGPHEGAELEMLLDGVKPMALVTDITPFSSYIRLEKLIMVPLILRTTQHYIVSLPDQEWRIKKLLKEFNNLRKKNQPIIHARIGFLLGYTKQDIKKFLNVYPL